VPANYSPYFAVQVTLTSANTNYNLYDLVTAIEANAAPSVRELSLQADSNAVLVGDASLGTTRYGYQLTSGASRTYRSFAANVPLSAIWARSTSSGAKINIEGVLS
jgi:hypothetical protein